MWPELATGVTDVAMAWEASRVPKKFRDWYQKQDPILLYVRKLLRRKLISRDAVLRLDREVSARNSEAREFAVASPMPPGEPALTGVFA